MGGPTFGKNSQIISFFFFDGVPYITRIYDGLSVGSSLGKREMRALGGENYSQIQGWALLTRNFTLVLLLQSI